MKVSPEFKVGFLVILGLLILFMGARYLSGNAIFNSDRTFYALLENSEGLKPSNEVKLSGHKIGEVEEVGLYLEDPVLILVKFSVADDDLQIPKGSQAWVVTDLLGTSCIDLRLDTNKVEPGQTAFYKEGDTIPSFIKPSVIDRVNETLIQLKETARDISKRVKKMN